MVSASDLVLYSLSVLPVPLYHCAPKEGVFIPRAPLSQALCEPGNMTSISKRPAAIGNQWYDNQPNLQEALNALQLQ